MDRDAEIAEIRRELDILRARHALYARWGRILKVFFTIVAPLFAIALAVAICDADPLAAGFFVAMVLALSAIVYLTFSPSDRRRGWIDLASGLRSPVSPLSMYPILPFVLHRDGSDAQIIEEQISEREQRLFELGAAP